MGQAWTICPAPSCLVPIPKGRVFCDDCWGHLPKKMQLRIGDLWGQRELANELRRAIDCAGRKIKREKRKAES